MYVYLSVCFKNLRLGWRVESKSGRMIKAKYLRKCHNETITLLIKSKIKITKKTLEFPYFVAFHSKGIIAIKIIFASLVVNAESVVVI